MTPQQLIARLLAQRETTLPLAPGKSVQVRRPAEDEMAELRRMTGSEIAHRFVVGWAGITEADVLGASIGADSPVEFDAELWRVMVSDRAAWIQAVVVCVRDQVTQHLAQQAEVAKNSAPDSITSPASSTRAKIRRPQTPPTA